MSLPICLKGDQPTTHFYKKDEAHNFPALKKKKSLFYCFVFWFKSLHGVVRKTGNWLCFQHLLWIYLRVPWALLRFPISIPRFMLLIQT